MLSSDEEKRMLEQHAGEIFLRCYQQRFGIPGTLLHSNLPRKPDLSCKIGEQPVDLEIAHLYGSEEEAMLLLGRELDQKTRYALKQLWSDDDPHLRLVHSLNRILAHKSTRRYEAKRVWLVIRNAHPAWRTPIIRQQLDQVSLPRFHPFGQIWIIGDLQGSSGMLQLYPGNPQTG
ncbi:hypothetical protein LJ739_15620 [Aestuariibacter halophilus]|uniref:Uncharacterized protein n=1 Tax=Fluctibacter halophilus TaxID=226011 RepID=A0ABS8GAR7_9ALTE|nr:hypothetical protein [Aestuariibacter halophilus]MCC2617680.1 hypothetical protein [Aestuariibacter halophilus]